MRLSLLGPTFAGITAFAKQTHAVSGGRYPRLRLPTGDQAKWNTMAAKVVRNLDKIPNNTEYVVPCTGFLMDSPSCLELTVLELLVPVDPDRHSKTGSLHYLERQWWRSKKDDERCEIHPSLLADKNGTAEDLLSDAARRCTRASAPPSENDYYRAETLLTTVLERYANDASCREGENLFCPQRTYAAVASNWMESCAGVDLPSEMTNPVVNIILEEESDGDGGRLACMISFALSSRPSRYGLEPKTGGEICFPYGLDEDEYVCPDKIGPAALEHCSKTQSEEFGNVDFGNESFDSIFDSSNDAEMSFSYSFSYSYSFSFDYGGDKSDDITPGIDYVKEMCDIVDKLNTERGKSCLKPLCPLPESSSPSIYPSSSPTSGPIKIETNAPSSSPSLQPITTDTTQPTMHQTVQPTKLSTNQPSIRPSMPPASSPSNLPTIFLSKPPSTSPTIHPQMLPSTPPTTPLLTPQTSIPSTNPTASLTNSPTIYPTDYPTKYIDPPTVPTNKGSVEIKFKAKFTLSNVTGVGADYKVPTEGPELFAIVKVLTNAIGKFLPKDAVAKILSIGGTPVIYPQNRRLEDEGGNGGLLIDFEVTMKKECETSSCLKGRDKADEIYTDIKGDLQEAVEVGQMAYIIQREAVKEDVQVLALVAVDTDSFESKEPLVKIETKVATDLGPKGSTGTTAHVTILLPFGTLAIVMVMSNFFMT